MSSIAYSTVNDDCIFTCVFTAAPLQKIAVWLDQKSDLFDNFQFLLRKFFLIYFLTVGTAQPAGMTKVDA